MTSRLPSAARLSIPLASGLAALLFAPSAKATSLYWDTNGTDIADSGAATGTWGTDAFWSTDSTGLNVGPVTLTAATTGVDDLFFSAGTTGTGGIVTVDASQTARKMTFEEGTITLSGGTLITLAGGGGLTVDAGAGDVIVSTALTANGSNIFSVGSGRTLTLNGIFTGTIDKTGGGTMTLSGTPLHTISSWTVNGGTLVLNSALGAASLEVIPGGTVNNGGTVKLSASNRVGNGSIFTINAGGVFDTNGQGDLIGRVEGAGSITNTSTTASNLQVNPNGGSGTFSGVIGGGAGTINFNVNGNGTQILSGPNIYTGTTQIRLGSLSINSIGNVSGGASAIGAPTTAANGIIAMGNAANTGTLVYTGTGHSTDRQVRIGTNSSTPANTNTGGATITANGDSNAALVFSNATFNAQTNAATGVGANRTLTLQGSSTGANTISGVIRDNLISGTATGTARVGLTKAGAGTWVLSGTNTYTGATLISGGTLQIGNGIGTTGSIATASAITNDATLRINRGGALTMANAISGTGTLVKDFATGDLILSGNNSYSGGTTVNAGRLFISAATALPGTGTVSVANGATLAFNASGTYNQSISLANGAKLSVRPAGTTLGSVTLPTTGSVIFNSDDAVTNAFSLGNNVALTGNLTVQVGGDNATVGAVTLAGDVSGSGFGLTKTQGGTLTLSGTNTYSGATLVSAGTLFVTGSLASGVTVRDAATLGGGGTVAAVSFAGGSFLDIALAIGGNALDSTATISFSTAGFGIDNLRYNGAAVDWGTIADNTYTLITGNLDETNLDNFGSGKPFDIGGGRSAYFKEGSLQLVVIPEPAAALLAGLGVLTLLRRRR